jgi:hypothetical protein
MFGHTHDQYFSLYQSSTNPEKTIGVTQIGPSGTTETWKNPAYGLIDIDAETLLPINYRIIGFDLDQANADGAPEWITFVDYARDYLQGGISTESLYNFAYQLTQDEDLFWQNTWDNARRAGEKEVGTTEEWLQWSQGQFCSIISSNDRDLELCNNNRFHWPLDTLIGKWK